MALLCVSIKLLKFMWILDWMEPGITREGRTLPQLLREQVEQRAAGTASGPALPSVP